MRVIAMFCRICAARFGTAGLVVTAASLVALARIAANWVERPAVPTIAPEPQNVRQSLILPRARRITPTNDYAKYVDVVRLADLLTRLTPRSFKPEHIKIAIADHALRLWGSEAVFPTGRLQMFPGQTMPMYQFSMPELTRVLFDERAFEAMFPKVGRLLASTPWGVMVCRRTPFRMELDENYFPDGEHHIDHFASILGELGVSSHFPLFVDGRDATITDLITDSMARVSISQELEFTTKAFLHFLELPATWQDRGGGIVCIDNLVARIAQQPLGKGSCFGTHAVQVLGLALRIDSEAPFLQTTTRFAVERRLRHVVNLLNRQGAESAEGSWNRHWCRAEAGAARDNAVAQATDSILVSGHHLEWIAIVPAEFRPNDVLVGRAIAYLQRECLELEADPYYLQYPGLSHVAAVLCQLANVDAYSTYQAISDTKQPLVR